MLMCMIFVGMFPDNRYIFEVFSAITQQLIRSVHWVLLASGGYWGGRALRCLISIPRSPLTIWWGSLCLPFLPPPSSLALEASPAPRRCSLFGRIVRPFLITQVSGRRFLEHICYKLSVLGSEGSHSEY